MYKEYGQRDEFDEWWRECDEQYQPCVAVRTRRKYATVECDMLPTSTHLTESACETVRDIIRHYHEVSSNRPQHKKSITGWSAGQGHMLTDDLLIEDARECAEEIAEVVFENSNWQNPSPPQTEEEIIESTFCQPDS